LKYCISEGDSKITTSGRTNLFYLPKYFRKGEREKKDRTKEVMEKVI
jgi:hypothetical protein